MKSENLKNRKDLTGKRVFTDISQLILFIIFISVWIFDSFFYKEIYFFAVYVPLFLRILIVTLIASFAFWLVVNGMKTVFGEIRERPHVITKGVFSIVRHPVYLGAMLIYLAIFLSTFSILTSITYILVIALYIFLSLSEEKELIKRFGDEYREYINNVPMLIPYKIFFRN